MRGAESTPVWEEGALWGDAQGVQCHGHCATHIVARDEKDKDRDALHLSALEGTSSAPEGREPRGYY